MFDLNPKSLAFAINKMGFNATQDPQSPNDSCIIRSHHHDVIIKKGKRGDFKIIFKNLLIGQVVKLLSAANLNQVKEILKSK